MVSLFKKAETSTRVYQYKRAVKLVFKVIIFISQKNCINLFIYCFSSLRKKKKRCYSQQYCNLLRLATVQNYPDKSDQMNSLKHWRPTIFLGFMTIGYLVQLRFSLTAFPNVVISNMYWKSKLRILSSKNFHFRSTGSFYTNYFNLK